MFKVPVLRKDVGLPKDIKIKWNFKVGNMGMEH